MIPEPLICTSLRCDHTWKVWIFEGINQINNCPKCMADLRRQQEADEAEEREDERQASIRADTRGKEQYYEWKEQGLI